MTGYLSSMVTMKPLPGQFLHWTLVIFYTLLATTTSQVNRNENTFDECVLFKSNRSYASRTSESYLELGYYDLPVARPYEHYIFDIAFAVLPDRVHHNGPLFSIGTDNFEYYEWKAKAVKTQFFVVEFIYSAISMLIKALEKPYMYHMEIYRTFPHPYVIDDGKWHTVRAYRYNPDPDTNLMPHEWTLQFDELIIRRNVTPELNVDLYDRPAYLGGRPGFREAQFRGIIRNLTINQEKVRLRGKATYGLTEVWHCSAPEVKKFQEELQEEPRRGPTANGGRTPSTPKWKRKRPDTGDGLPEGEDAEEWELQ